MLCVSHDTGRASGQASNSLDPTVATSAWEFAERQRALASRMALELSMTACVLGACISWLTVGGGATKAGVSLAISTQSLIFLLKP